MSKSCFDFFHFKMVKKILTAKIRKCFKFLQSIIVYFKVCGKAKTRYPFFLNHLKSTHNFLIKVYISFSKSALNSLLDCANRKKQTNKREEIKLTLLNSGNEL